MTPEETIKFYEQQDVRVLKVAEKAARTGNHFLAAVNFAVAFNANVMQGLVGWRCGIITPVKPFKNAVDRVGHGLKLLISLGAANSCVTQLPVERAGLVSFLVDVPWPKVPTDELIADRLLDGVLSNGLRGAWDDSAWNKGIEKLQKKKRTALAFETYATYKNLLHAGEAEMAELVALATKLFNERERNDFFAGGEAAEGGDIFNAVTVDYRLAAVLKRTQFTVHSIHRWKWA